MTDYNYGIFPRHLRVKIFVVVYQSACTVEPPVGGNPRDQKKCPFKRGVRLWEVKNVVFV